MGRFLLCELNSQYALCVRVQLPVMEMLLKHGADKSASDINGQTAADLATALGHEDMVLLLTGKKPSKLLPGDSSICTDSTIYTSSLQKNAQKENFLILSNQVNSQVTVCGETPC